MSFSPMFQQGDITGTAGVPRIEALQMRLSEKNGKRKDCILILVEG